MAALAVYGLGTSTGAAAFNTLLQAEIPEKLRGRIFAAFDMLCLAQELDPVGPQFTCW